MSPVPSHRSGSPVIRDRQSIAGRARGAGVSRVGLDGRESHAAHRGVCDRRDHGAGRALQCIELDVLSAVAARAAEMATLRAIGFAAGAVAVASSARGRCCSRSSALRLELLFRMHSSTAATISTLGGAQFDSQLVYSTVDPPRSQSALHPARVRARPRRAGSCPRFVQRDQISPDALRDLNPRVVHEDTTAFTEQNQEYYRRGHRRRAMS